MKINNINKLLKIYNNNLNVKKANDVKMSKNKDELKLSHRAMEYQYALNKLKEVPDIRKNKVDRIKEEIKTGTYVVDGEKIVEKMFEKANFDKRI